MEKFQSAEEERDCLSEKIRPSFYELYTSCLFQACRTLFGDGEAYTRGEQIYFAITVVLGAIMQASVFGSVANLLRSFDEDRQSFERKSEAVRHKMEFLRMPGRLQDRVLAYYEKQWQFHKSLGDTTATAFIGELSRPLQMQVKIDLYKDLLMSVPFLQTADAVIAEELVLRLDSHTFMKNDLITRKGDPADWMAFVSRGLIAVLDPRLDAPSADDGDDSHDVVIRMLRRGSHLGELGSLFVGARSIRRSIGRSIRGTCRPAAVRRSRAASEGPE